MALVLRRGYKFISPFSCICIQRFNLHTQAHDVKDRREHILHEHETSFGFEKVSESEKAEKVHDVFKNVASNYDLMNDVMSAGIHRIWKDVLISRLSPFPGFKLIDVAGGTGDVAVRFLEFAAFQESDVKDQELVEHPLVREDENVDLSSSGPQTEAYVVDINEEMLRAGRSKRGSQLNLKWVHGDAQELPFEDCTFDAYTIAFGIRNVVHIDRVLSEAHRVLKRGGRFLCLEFSQVQNPLVRSLYDSYSFQVIPVMGQLLAKDWNAYQYLVESIRKFPSQEDFKLLIQCAGFRGVTYENLLFGVAAIHSGFKL